jgi:signal peptidase II
VKIARQHLWAGFLVAVVIVLDLVTKSWALRTLPGGDREILGGLVPLHLTFNLGAAFGLSIGDDPRWIFVPISLVAVGVLVYLIVKAGPGDGLRTFAAALVLGGALGNLYDRVRWEHGVVDFIGPINLGFMYWPVFNVADMAITVGAVMLAVAFWNEDRRERAATTPTRADGSSRAPGKS